MDYTVHGVAKSQTSLRVFNVTSQTLSPPYPGPSPPWECALGHSLQTL